MPVFGGRKGNSKVRDKFNPRCYWMGHCLVTLLLQMDRCNLDECPESENVIYLYSSRLKQC